MTSARHPSVRVLVVISDRQIRQLAGWIVAEMDLRATLTATWREAIVSTTGAPACIVADLDDIGDKTAGWLSYARSGAAAYR